MTNMKKNYISPIIDVLDDDKEECIIATSETAVQIDGEESTDITVVADGFDWNDFKVQ